MNVLMAIYSCDPEGRSESAVGYDWLKQISQSHHVFLITDKMYKKTLDKYLTKNVTAYYVSAPTFMNFRVFIGYPPSCFFFSLNAYLLAKKIIREHHIDVVHHITPTAFRFSDFLALLNKPFFLGPLGGGLKIPKNFNSVKQQEGPVYLLRYFDRIRFSLDPFFIKTYNAAQKIWVMGRYLFDVIPKRYHHKMAICSEIYIDSSKYGFVPKRSNKVLHLLFVGRLIPLKGVAFLIKAVAKVRQEHPELDWKLTVIGDGSDYSKHCQQLTVELGIEDRVKFLGYLKRDEIIHYYQTCDIFCFPSLKDSSGGVLLEAMSCGIPMIVADVGGPAEIVKEGCGIRIPVVNEEDFVERLKQAILELGTDQTKREQIALSARQLIENEYDSECLRKKGANLYEQVINEHYENSHYKSDNQNALT